MSLALRLSLLVLFSIPLAQTVDAQSLNSRVLIVYNANNSDSRSVALYYQSARSIPSQNLCPITPSSTTQLTWTNYVAQVKNPVLACLSSVGPANILYIVFTYQTPFTLIAPDTYRYSLDSFVSDIYDVAVPAGAYGYPAIPQQPYFTDAQTQGLSYVPFQSLAAYRTQHPSSLIYSVFRLDAPTAALAMGLVDKAIAAENSGLQGQACLDRRYANLPTLTDYGYTTAEWDMHNAANLARAAGLAVTEDSNNAEFGTAPAPLRCDGAALYTGWYSHAYNDAFSWNTGAIGFHIDSSSALSPRVGPNWSEGALLHGITATSGSVAEPYLFGLLHADQVFRNLFEGANIGDAFFRSTLWIKWMLINMGDPLYRPYPNGVPAALAPQNTFAFSPQYVVGGKPSQGTITLAVAAPPGGTTIALHNPHPEIVTMPASVSVPAGSTTGTFPITTIVVRADSPFIITGNFGSSVVANTLTVEPLLGGPSLPCCAYGGTPIPGFMVLNDNAPTGGTVVNFSSSNPAAASVPATVTVPAGNFYQSFTVTTHPVDTTANLVLTATYAGASDPVTITVTAAYLYSISAPYSIKGGQSAAGAVALSGPAGPSGITATLTSSNPAVVSIPGSVTFAPGVGNIPITVNTTIVSQRTTVTLTARAGTYTRTFTLTVTP